MAEEDDNDPMKPVKLEKPNLPAPITSGISSEFNAS